MKRVLAVFPTRFDQRLLPAIGRARGVEVLLSEPSDWECRWDFDALGLVERIVREQRGEIAGVFSSSDYPGATVAAAIATALGLPGSHPAAVMRASHKYYSRLSQREAAPEATPPFALVDPRRADGGPPAIDFPCFVKPVKGAFSVLARRIESQAELEAYLAHSGVRNFLHYTMRIFNQLAARLGGFELDGGWILAEGLLTGRLVTVEGFATPAGVEIVGIVDSTVDPATGSFLRFDYPSALPGGIQARMADIARRVVERLGLAHTLFNIEMVHDPCTDAVHVIEVNPRMCGQFADLYHAVDGVHGYEIALDLALGRRPRLVRGQGPCGAAVSVPLRVFRPVRVERAPSAAELAALEAAFPGTCLWSECESGQELLDLEGLEDGASIRYAVLNTAAADRRTLDRRVAALQERLGFEFAPLEPGAGREHAARL